MKHDRVVDLLIIGLGPAGASAARLAARFGLRVLAVDKRPRPGSPLQCAEYIPMPLHSHCRLPQQAVQPVVAMRTHLPGGDTLHTALPGMMIHRPGFDAALCADARSAGAELLSACRLKGLDAASRTAELAYQGQTLRVGYGSLIAADGPRSAVARLLALPELETLYGSQYTLELDIPMADTEVWLGEEYPGGYAWLFPKGERANLGVAGYSQCARQLKHSLLALYKRLRADGVVGGILARSGGAIPVSGLREPLCHGPHILFAGDAAGLCHPISGAGIASAVLSGEAAAEAVCEEGPGSPAIAAGYNETIEQLYGRSLRHARRRREELRRLWLVGKGVSHEQWRRSWIACDEYLQGKDQ